MKTVRAIFFDIGGTLVEKSREGGRNLQAIDQMRKLLGINTDTQKLAEHVLVGEQEYKHWRSSTMLELSPEEKWSRFFLPEQPEEVISRHARKLQYWWSEYKSKKWVEPITSKTLKELHDRGYILGTISHTSPRYLQEAGLEELFRVTIYASDFGRRKPDPLLFREAAWRAGVLPEECAYVGDRPSRDVLGPREAGIGQVIYLRKQVVAPESLPCPMKPDIEIDSITRLLDLFPQVQAIDISRPVDEEQSVLYDIALSTMWWNKEAENAETFFSKGRQLGFARFELNHQVPTEAFNSIDFNRYSIGSLHDPCPAFVSAKQLERDDVQITSLDENLRAEAVDGMKQTIDQAYQLGSRMVVIHPGRVSGDHSLDEALRQMYREGKKGTPEYNQLRDRLVSDRLERGIPHQAQLLRSLEALIEYSSDLGLRLGFENRFHYYELPVFEEMQEILNTFQQPWVGWQLDIGHLQVHHALGLTTFKGWMEAFSPRMIGVHLHDVVGISDHRPPGTGEVDFSYVSKLLPETTYRTLEVEKRYLYSEIETSLGFLETAGCIQRI